MKEIVFYARGGQGAVTAAAVLVAAAAKEGKYAQAFPFFGGERRGAPVKAFLRIDSKPVMARGLLHNPDCIIVLDTKLPAIMNVWEGLKPGGIAVFNTNKSSAELKFNVPLSKIGTVDANQIADSIFGSMAIPFTNFAMLGAFAATTGWIGLSSIIEASYSKFGGKTAKNNEKSTRMAYESTKVMSFDVTGLTDDVHQSETTARKIKLELYPGMVINKESNAKTGSWRTRKPVLLEEKCNFCGLCALLCPEGVLEASKETGWKPDLDQCKGCGICANECPRDAIEMVLER